MMLWMIYDTISICFMYTAGMYTGRAWVMYIGIGHIVDAHNENNNRVLIFQYCAYPIPTIIQPNIDGRIERYCPIEVLRMYTCLHTPNDG